jgi:hypothetical protein
MRASVWNSSWYSCDGHSCNDKPREGSSSKRLLGRDAEGEHLLQATAHSTDDLAAALRQTWKQGADLGEICRLLAARRL